MFAREAHCAARQLGAQQRDVFGRVAPIVDHAPVRPVVPCQPVLAPAPAVVDVVEEDRKLLVEHADAPHRLGAHQHAREGRLLERHRDAPVAIDEVVLARAAVEQQPREMTADAPRHHHVELGRQLCVEQLERAVRELVAAADAVDVGMRRHVRGRAPERCPIGQHDVVVREQHVARAGRRRKSLIDGSRVAEVPAVANHLHRRARRLDGRERAVGRSVVDEPHVGRGILRRDRRDAFDGDAAAVPVDDHDGDLRHRRGLRRRAASRATAAGRRVGTTPRAACARSAAAADAAGSDRRARSRRPERTVRAVPAACVS